MARVLVRVVSAAVLLLVGGTFIYWLAAGYYPVIRPPWNVAGAGVLAILLFVGVWRIVRSRRWLSRRS
jgi:hypothetical protein